MKRSLHFLLTAALMSLAMPALAGPTGSETAATGQSAREPVSTQPVTNTGVVEGVVRYKADPKRPWQFSRYYVQNAKDGPLAEAVVALEGSTLVVSAPTNTPVTRTVDQVNFQFVPETMALRVGDSVRVINSDDALHNVMTLDGGKPFNVVITKGKEFAHTFDRAGGLNEPIRLSCAFHGGMRSWIYVFDHPYFKLTEPDGRFRFENVPAGQQTLGIVHPAGKLHWRRTIEVKPNGNAPLEIILSPDDMIVGEAKK